MSLFRMFARRILESAEPRTLRSRLRVEPLEAREVPAVDLLGIANSDFPSNKPLFVPITSVTADGTVDFTVTSETDRVKAELLTGGRTIRFTVSGKDANNQPFSGDFTIRLFEDIAPLATGNIINLVKTNYYKNKEFHRVVNDFVIQGGSPNGDGQGGSDKVSDARDEYNAAYTFASRGIVAMANATDDNNNAQFFITDPFIVDSASSQEVPAPLDRRSQFLNFNHSIVGILTSGFDIYQKIMDVPKVLGNDGAVSQPVNDVIIENTQILDFDDRNAVVKLTALTDFLGEAKITVTGSNGGVNSTKEFTVTSVADTVNDRPFLGAIGNITTNKNTPAQFTLPFVELDTGDSQTFTVGRVTNTANGPVFTTLNPAEGTATVDASGKVTVTPATGFVGSFTITVGVRDAQDRIGSSLGLNDARNWDTEELQVTVQDGVSPPPPPANTAPTISNVANQTTPRGQTIGPIGFTIGDTETAVANLTLTVTSSNPTLVPNENITFGGSGSNRTLTMIPVAGQTGATTITVTVRDGGNLTASDTFDLAVTVPPPVSPPTITLTGTKNSVGPDRPVLFIATVTNGSGGTVQFTDSVNSQVLGNIPLIEGKALLSTSFASGADHQITAKYIPNSGDGATSTPLALAVTDGTGPVVITAEGSAAGTLATVTIKNQDGTVRHTKNPYGDFRGVVRVKVADVNNDGQLDAVAVPGFGGGPHIVVFDGSTGNLIYQKMIFEPHFRGGLSLDVGDAKGLGYGQILVGAGQTGGPRVTLLDAAQDKVLLNYFAYDANNRGGVTVAMSDLRGGNQLNIITGAGNGLSPNVNVYNPFQVVGFESTEGKFGSFVAGTATDTTGIRVAAGKLENNRRDIFVGPLDKTDSTALDNTFNPLALGVFVG